MVNLPPLTIHAGMVGDLFAAGCDGLAMGLVQMEGVEYGLLALILAGELPEMAGGFELGHRVLATDSYEVVQLTLQLDRQRTYHVLVNPASIVVQRTLAAMLQKGVYFIVFVTPEGAASVFQSQGDPDDLDGLRANWDRLLRSKTSEAEYQRTVVAFGRNPDPLGELLEWIGSTDPSQLEIQSDPLVMRSNS